MIIRSHPILNRVAIAGGWLLFGITALIATYFALVAQRLFEERATLRLEPTYVDRFAAANASHVWAAQRRVIIFGDSRVAMWDPIPSAPDAQFVLRGVGGETMSQMRYRFARDVLELKPDTVIIQAGINDLVAVASVPNASTSIRNQAFSILRSFIEQSRAAGIRVIIVTVVRPGPVPIWRRPFWPNSVTTDVERFNADMRQLEGDGVKILDADKLLTDGGHNIVNTYSSDTLHLTKLAYRRLNDELMVILKDK